MARLKKLLSSKTIAEIQNIKAQYAHLIDQDALSEEELMIRQKCEESFHEFVKYSWDYIDTDKFSDNWHIKGLCDHLQDFFEGKIKNLIVNIPPRTGKTNICYVLFVAWGFIKDNKKSFLCTSYSKELSMEQSVKCRDFIMSPWFKKLWGHKVQIGSSKRKSLITLKSGGDRRSTSITSNNMGFGGHFILMDDINDITNIKSDSKRQTANNAATYIGISRTRKFIPGLLVTQQRVHADDATANFLKNNNAQKFVHFSIPEFFESNRRCITVPVRGSKKPWQDPRTKDGELLDPSWRTKEFFARVLAGFSKSMVRSQYQQDPILTEGNIINPEWFMKWKNVWGPSYNYILQSWDTALLSEEESTGFSAFSACTTWGVYEDRFLNNHVMLIDIFTGRLSYPELRNKAIDLDKKFEPDEIVIEKRVNGYSLIQELENFGLPVTGFNPGKHGSKETRASHVSGFIESGFVWLPMEEPDFLRPTPMSQRILDAAKFFPQTSPGSDTADIIDSMTQALIKLAERSLVANRQRIRDKELEQKWKKDND